MQDFSLNDREQERRDTLAEEISNAQSRLVEAIGEYNDAMLDARDNVEGALAEYNNALDEARTFVERIAGEARGYLDGADEAWVESDEGTIASTWTDAWEDIDLDELELEWPNALELDEPAHADDLQALPTDKGEE